MLKFMAVLFDMTRPFKSFLWLEFKQWIFKRNSCAQRSSNVAGSHY